jgi:hypothetical protein
VTPAELRAAADRAEELLANVTPGPWYVAVDDSASKDQVYVCTEHNDGSWREDYTGPFSLGFDAYDPTPSERANLALIAAAPDLLATLAPAAHQYADTQDENERLRTVLDGLLDAVGDPDELRELAWPTGVVSPEVDALRVHVWRIADAVASAQGERTNG